MITRPKLFLGCFIVTGLVCLLSCGGSGGSVSPGSGNSANQNATVTVTLSDPVVCGTARGGPFQHIYVTISDVQAFTSVTSTQNGVDLTPGLGGNPMQVDLLASPGAGCILATLGSSASVPPGSYQAVRVFLAGTDQISKIKGGTKCPNTPYGPAANCAVLADASAVYLDPVTIGTSQFDAGIAGAQVSFSTGAQTLNIDFDSCASMVFAYSGEYGIDPTLHASLMPSAGSITGKLLDANTLQPIAGDLIVALEALDSNSVDHEIMQTAPVNDGSFVLCPVAPGTYDIVAAAVSSTGVAYVATITLGVQPGASLGTIPLKPVSGPNQTLAGIAGQVTAAGPSQTNGYTHLVISALQSVTLNGNTTWVTVPLPSQYSSTLRAIATGSANYQVYVPAGTPLAGSFRPNGGTVYQQSTASPVTYKVEAQSWCSPATQQTPSGLSVSSGVTSTAPTIAFAGCPAA